ncbi:MAG: glycosyltransferase family 2 protein [Eggerthellaceae bacterium]|nr:glycosyltransferase family 2 protein [Eggerthellaceae bacterium]
MKVLIIIPAHNEEGSIVTTVNSLKRLTPSIDYVVVNDGSSDRTKELCEQNAFNIVNLPINVGLAGGFQAGMKYAYRNGYDAALQFDADGQHKPDYIQPMVDAMRETNADIVIGSRFITQKKKFSSRTIGSSIISGLIKLTTGKSIKDPTSGMRLYNAKMIELFVTKHDIAPEPDTIAYCLRKGAKVIEVPVEMQERLTGESYLSVSKSISYMLRTCISILILQWFR